MDEVLKGYKISKAGIIPNNWTVKRLKDIAIKVSDKNSDISINTVFTNSAIRGIILQNDYFDREIANQKNLGGYYIAKTGDFIYNPRISKNAPAGPINRNLHLHEGIVSPLYTIFRLNSNEKIKYFEYFFSSNKWLRYMKSIANYGARHDRMNITNHDFMNMPIPYPKEKEQDKVVEILSIWDSAISKQKKLIESKKLLQKELMKNLLNGDVQFDGFTDKWKNIKLGEITNFYLGLTYTPRYVKEGIPFLSVKDINGGKISFDNTKYISSEEFEKSTKNAKPMQGDILFGRVGTLGNPIVIVDNNPFCIFVSLGIMRVNDKAYNFFIKHWMNSIFFKKQVHSQVAGSSQKNLNVGWLKNFRLKLPSISEQRKIAEVLTSTDKEIDLLKNVLTELKEQKKGLVQKLLTGEVRVKI